MISSGVWVPGDKRTASAGPGQAFGWTTRKSIWQHTCTQGQNLFLSHPWIWTQQMKGVYMMEKTLNFGQKWNLYGSKIKMNKPSLPLFMPPCTSMTKLQERFYYIAKQKDSR